MADDIKKPAEDIIDPQSTSISYGGKDYKIKPLSIKSILSLSRILGGRFGKIYDLFLLKISNGEKIEKIIDSLEADEILDIISLTLDIEKDEAEK